MTFKTSKLDNAGLQISLKAVLLHEYDEVESTILHNTEGAL